MEKKKFIRLVAEVLAWLQAPRSMNGAILGTALKPWDELREQENLNVFGWADANAYEEKLNEAFKS